MKNIKNKISKELYPIWNNINKEGFILTKFVMLENQILRLVLLEAGVSPLILYILLLSHRNTTTNECFPSLALLSKESGLSRTTILRNLKILQDKNFIQIIKRSGKYNFTLNFYYFPLEDFYIDPRSKLNSHTTKEDNKGDNKGEG